MDILKKIALQKIFLYFWTLLLLFWTVCISLLYKSKAVIQGWQPSSGKILGKLIKKKSRLYFLLPNYAKFKKESKNI